MSTLKVTDVLKKNAMVIALVLVVVFFAWQTKGAILSPQNFNNMIGQNGYVIILAVGMLLCILTGGNIDLSVGSIVCFVGAVTGTLVVTKGVNIWLAIVISLLVGVLIGVWQGFWIAFVRIPPFIVTLSGMLLWRGAANLILKGFTISPFPDEYNQLFNNFLGGGRWVAMAVGVAGSFLYVGFIAYGRMAKARKGYEQNNLAGEITKAVVVVSALLFSCYKLYNYKGLPMVLVLLAVIVIVYTYFTSKTVPGRYFYAVGGNEKAAKLSGVNTNMVYFFAYVNMAFLSAVAALVCVARFNSANPQAGTNYEMDAIASCFIGGASAYGGIGTVPGVIVGAIFMGVLNNGMSTMGIDANWQRAVKGLVLLAAVAFDVISKKKGR